MDAGNHRGKKHEVAPKIWAIAMLGALWIACIIACEAWLDGRNLWLSHSAIDLGAVQQGTHHRIRVWVINPTGSGVIISPVTGCGCTVANLRKSVLRPVDITPIDILVEASGHAGTNRRRVELICRAGDVSWREPIEVQYTLRPTGSETN